MGFFTCEGYHNCDWPCNSSWDTCFGCCYGGRVDHWESHSQQDYEVTPLVPAGTDGNQPRLGRLQDCLASFF